jgi:hypothetical protein
MNTYRKLGFTSQESFYALADAAGLRQENEGEYSYVNCAVHEIGKVCIAYEQGENGPTCTEYDPRYAVDIIFFEEMPEAFEAFIVWPDPIGVHVFAGYEAQYLEDFCANNPDSPFCTLATETE